MPSFEEVQQYLLGTWRMMTGRPEGLRMLDLSADGFWNSFFAIVVALPAMIAGWVTVANDIAGEPGFADDRLALIVRLAIVDLGTWVVPLAAFALIARPAGMSDRFVHYVVSSNWGSALIVWLMLPPAIIRLFAPAASDFTMFLSLALFGGSLVLGWRLTNVALGRGAAVATAVFVGMFIVSLVVLFTLQAAVGITSLDQPG